MKRYLLLLISGIFLCSLSVTVSALDPADLTGILAAVRQEEPDAIVLEIDLESRHSGGIVSVETDRGAEYYVRVDSAVILERERTWAGRGSTRITERILEDTEVLDLAAAYQRIIAYMSYYDRYSRIDPADFSSIEYEIEFGRLIIEVFFEGSGGELEIYMDPVTGEILESEWDD
ncbi:MAG: PepSY domain-containing protein [Alkalispirochaeta sp.]